MTELKDLAHGMGALSVGGGVPLDPKTRTSYLEPELTDAEVDQMLKDRFLTPSKDIPWSLLNELQTVPELSQQEYSRIYSSLLVTPPPLSRTAIRSRRRGIAGEICKYEEVFDRQSLESGGDGMATAMNSLSMKRKFGSSKATGESNFLPFQPGGLDEANIKTNKELFSSLHRDKNGLFDVPLGFSHGLNVTTQIEELDEKVPLLQEEDEDDKQDQEDDEDEDMVDIDDSLVEHADDDQSVLKDIIDEFLPASTIVAPTAKAARPKPKKREWAHVVELSHKIENFEELVPNMARKWPFELDTFQQEAIYHLEQGDSVFVAAHTSAGKTVVAEYAIAMANRNMTKAIYTSPIKALSNQKFRDFKETFDDIEIGVLTGDVQINPEAGCLIMTTEILRSMLYRGADLIRDVEFVIFDEVHYVNDVDRGVVWEEVIIMLPEHVKVILLSATVPNTLEFASWVGRTKQKNIYVISTPKRPVPLEIYAFAKQKMFKLIDANRNFIKKGYEDHVLALSKKTDDGKDDKVPGGGRGGRGGARGAVTRGSRGGRSGRGGARGGGRGNFTQRDGPNKNSWIQLVQHLKAKDLLPAVVFVFSKKRCEQYADTLQSQDFTTAKEKSEIHLFINKSVSRLKKEDRDLPQILKVREMLSRGIGLHHGGLLPIVKEFIEILFARGLLKMLFVTETFAMGLNLPTRTVVFSELRKHDGTGFRDLLPGEFTQMSGRAGRRGLDKIGTVIVMAYNLPLDQNSFRDVALGTPTKLVSQFRLTYNMILNLVRIEALKVEEMIKRSFSEDANQSLLPENQNKAKQLEEKLAKYPKFSCSDCDPTLFQEIYKVRDEYLADYRELIKSAMDSAYYLKKFRKGRLIFIRNDRTGESLPAIITGADTTSKNISILAFRGNANSYRPRTNIATALCMPFMSMADLSSNDSPDLDDSDDEEKTERGDTPGASFDLVKSSFISTFFPDLATIVDHARVKVYNQTVGLDSVDFVTNVEVKPSKDRDSLYESVRRIFVKADSMRGLPFSTMSPEIAENYHRVQESRVKLLSCIENMLLAQGTNHSIKGHLAAFKEKYELEKELESVKNLISDENLDLLPDYEQRLRVLRHLEFINLDTTVEGSDEEEEVYSSRLTITLKGRVACEVNQGWELVVTELVLGNFLGDLEPEELVALLSVFVYEGKRQQKSGPDDGRPPVSEALTPRLARGQEKIMEIMEKVLGVYAKFQVNLTPEEESFLESNRFGLVNVVYQWAKGLSFKEIMELENAEVEESEGTIVRVITRLDEVCRDVRNAALIIGDSQLHFKMMEAQEKIKRDIVFCASLYL